MSIVADRSWQEVIETWIGYFEYQDDLEERVEVYDEMIIEYADGNEKI